MLGFLLFAGALHVDLGDLAQHKWAIAILATLGVLTSTVLVAGLTWVALGLARHEPPSDRLPALWRTHLTDRPDRRARPAQEAWWRPSLWRFRLAESRYSTTASALYCSRAYSRSKRAATASTRRTWRACSCERHVGGAVFGLAAGLLVYRLLKSVDDYRVEILLSLALVAGGYAAADALHLSGPIAMVVAGSAYRQPRPQLCDVAHDDASTSTSSGDWSTRYSIPCCSC